MLVGLGAAVVGWLTGFAWIWWGWSATALVVMNLTAAAVVIGVVGRRPMVERYAAHGAPA